MKTYNNGPRKGMMYGGATRRKPMMYGGTAKKPRKKMQMGGMTQSAPMNQAGMQPAMGMPKMMMAGGGKAMKGDLDKDGKMSGYEKARQNAIESNMKKKR